MKYLLLACFRGAGPRWAMCAASLLTAHCSTPSATAAQDLALFAPQYDSCGGALLNGAWSDSPDALVNVVWNWGDGSYSTNPPPAYHRYSRNGRYQATATSHFSGGHSARSTITLDINSAGGRDCAQPISLSVQVSDILALGCGDVRLEGSVTPVGGALREFIVDWGDGTRESAAFPLSHRYQRNSSYLPTLTAVAEDGSRSSIRVPVNVSSAGDPACRSTQGVDLQITGLVVQSCGEVELRGTAGVAYGRVQEIEVDWGDGVISRSESLPMRHRFSSNGTRTIKATAVHSSGGTDVESRQVSIVSADSLPCSDVWVLGLDVTSTNLIGCGSLLLEGTVVSSNGVVDEVVWHWGDGTASAGIFPFHHRYLKPGTYHATAHMTDDEGESALFRYEFIVPPWSDPACAAGPLTISQRFAGPCGEVSVNATVPPEWGPVTSLTWNWGDGTSLQSASPAFHRYTSGGTFQVEATARLLSGEMRMGRISIVAAPAPDCASAAGDGMALDQPVESPGGLITVTGTVVVPTGMLDRIEWNWGDGTPTESQPLPAAHTYSRNGVWLVQATAISTLGQRWITRVPTVVRNVGRPPAIVLRPAPRDGGRVELQVEPVDVGAVIVQTSADLRTWTSILTNLAPRTGTSLGLPVDRSGPALFYRVRP